MKLFYSCDWGTSVFRLRLVDAADARIVSELATDFGISYMFDLCEQSGMDSAERAAFYETYLFEQISKLGASVVPSSFGIPIVLSGMVSSNKGMLELPYKVLPVKLDGSGLVVRKYESSNRFKQDLYIISGVRSEIDVMRGEETMLVGCGISSDQHEHLLVFPGTHSKHLTVKNGFAIGIRTFLTGEMFQLLSTHSILASSVLKNEEKALHSKHFAKGVTEGLSSNLLNSIFLVRTNQLLQRLSPAENYHYLSGLLIGHEIKAIKDNRIYNVSLISNKGLLGLYSDVFSIALPEFEMQCIDSDTALVKGQLTILQKVDTDFQLNNQII